MVDGIAPVGFEGEPCWIGPGIGRKWRQHRCRGKLESRTLTSFAGGTISVTYEVFSPIPGDNCRVAFAC